jgi:hypothetical protein
MTTYVMPLPTCAGCHTTLPTQEALDLHIAGKPHFYAPPDRFCSVCCCGESKESEVHIR